MNKKKKVIFVGGSSYSGSTLLDMAISSGPDGFSAGEVYALFYPWQRWHIEPRCSCNDKMCSIWTAIKKKGVGRLYFEIFKMFPNIKYIVDSSKDPLWISANSKKLKLKGIECKNILIYKTPLEFAYSKYKRGSTKWKKAWKNYYQLYFSLIKNPIIIKYSDFVGMPQKYLKIICMQLDINYFEGKESFWKYNHHTLFGNNSAKIHLYAKENEKFDEYKNKSDLKKSLNKMKIEDVHRRFYYDQGFINILPNFIINEVSNDHKIKNIQKYLENNKIGLEIKKNNGGIKKFSIFIIFLFKIRNEYRKIYSKNYERKLRFKKML